MTIKQDQQLKILIIFQKMYFEKMLDHFEFSDLRLIVTFMKQNLKLKIFKKQIDIIFIEQYQSIIKFLMYTKTQICSVIVYLILIFS